MTTSVSEAGSMTPTERELYAPETSRSIADIQGRGERMEQQLRDAPLMAPGSLPLRALETGIGGPTRERMIQALEKGGTPVRDERGMTVGVVRRGSGVFGGDDYVGRPDYNPIAARVNRATGTGDQFPMFEERGGVIQARGLTPTERAMMPSEDRPSGTVMGTTAPPPPPPAAPGDTAPAPPDMGRAAALAEESARIQRARRRGRGATIVGGSVLGDTANGGQTPTLMG